MNGREGSRHSSCNILAKKTEIYGLAMQRYAYFAFLWSARKSLADLVNWKEFTL
jgi:hypothetical protein